MNGKKKPGSNQEMTSAYLGSAFEHMLAAGRSVRDLVEFSLERFGDDLIPELKRFLDRVQSGEIKVKGLPKGAAEALFGIRMTPRERDDLVRLAAYVRAERRGFVGGSPEEDWHAAEAEVDGMLAEKIGLVAKGRRALSQAGLDAERELGDIKAVIAAWLKESARSPSAPAPEAAPKKAASKSTKKPAATDKAPKKETAAKAPKKETTAKAPAGKAESPAAPAGKKSSKPADVATGKKPAKK